MSGRVSTIGLLRAESRRILSRRLTVGAALAVLVMIGLFQLSVNSSLTPPGSAEMARAQTDYESTHRDWEQSHVAQEAECQQQTPVEPDCAQPEPTLDDFSYRPLFTEVAQGSVQVSVYVVALAAFIVAASFIGAEFSSGSIANWLTFVPRRGPVFGTKLLVAIGFGALFSLLASALSLGSTYAIAHLHGATTSGAGGLIRYGVRGVLVAAAVSVVGFCVGLIGRHTVVALGAMLAYVFVIFVRSAVLADVAWAQELTPWTPEGNVGAIVERGSSFSVPNISPDGSVEYVVHPISYAHGLGFWAVVVAAFVAAAALVFRRRDVT